MAAVIYLDTHVAAWLYAGRPDLIGRAARSGLERDELRISPMVVLELQYLYETKRTTEPAASVLETLVASLGVRVCDLPFAEVVRRGLEETWTRDPFDRIIVAQAALARAPLASKDRTIRKHYARAVWE